MSDAPRATATATIAGFPEGAKGVTPPTNPSGTGGFLSDVIVELGFADAETVDRAVEGARQPGRTVDLILLEGGALTEEELSRAIAERHGFDHVDLAQFEVNMDAASLIGRSTARRYRAAPIEIATDGAADRCCRRPCRRPWGQRHRSHNQERDSPGGNQRKRH